MWLDGVEGGKKGMGNKGLSIFNCVILGSRKL